MTHQYPAAARLCVAHVNVEHVLSSIERADLEVGAWVNVVGYVSSPQVRCTKDGCERRSRRSLANAHEAQVSVTHVQAILLWNAGSLQPQDYEQALEVRRAHLI